MNIEKELENLLLAERENTDGRFSYNSEIAFYDMIANGEVELLAQRYANRNAPRANHRHGVLSSNPVNNQRYHVIVMIALISRFCIEAGMDVTLSYSLSDIYIQKLDKATTLDEIHALSHAITTDYCKRMHDMKKEKSVSRHIVMSIDFIRSHIQDNLSVEFIADSLCLNSSYLSKLFKKEMGVSISEYIRKAKISVACNMLRHLDESSLSISNYLGFSSQSHFIQVFKKYTGLTPEDYRKKYYHQSWMNDNA